MRLIANIILHKGLFMQLCAYSCRPAGPVRKAFAMQTKKVVLVYSGGLDTSICVPMMREEYGYDEVITVTVDVGQPASDIAQAEEKAKAMKHDATSRSTPKRNSRANFVSRR